MTSTATPAWTGSTLTREQAKVLAHYATGESATTICATTGLDLTFVGAVLDEHAGNDRARAHTLVLEYQQHAQAVAAAKGTRPAAVTVLPRPAARTAPATPIKTAEPPAIAVPADTTPAADPIAVLLDQADATGDPRLHRAAGKIRELLDVLRTDLAAHQRQAQLRAEQDRLQARLAEIKGLLRPHRSTPVLPTPAAAAVPDSKAVRAWAAEQGLDCPTRGRIPHDVRAAYERRHTTAATSQVTAR